MQLFYSMMSNTQQEFPFLCVGFLTLKYGFVNN